ncbi:hypothetical protein CON22_09260 [Bacillus cereus]|nr:hypothetical protein CON22_09260 [Bacillus cereus]
MKGYMSPGRKVSEFQLKRNFHPTKSIVFVEGKSDEEFFQKIFSVKSCRFIQCEGKDNVKDVVRSLNGRKQKGFLGVVDKDFDKILGRELCIDNLFYTDTHDVETMIVASSFSLENAIRIYFDLDKYEAFLNRVNKSLNEIVFECVKYIGILRLISADENINLNFQELEYELFLDDSLNVDLSQLCEHVIQKSEAGVDKDWLLDKLISHVEEQYDIFHLACGHDFAGIIVYSLQTIFGSQKGIALKQSKLEELFRVTYNAEEFKETQLYIRFREWEEENKPFNLFDDVCHVDEAEYEKIS